MAQSTKQDTSKRSILLEGLLPFVTTLACARAWLTLVLILPAPTYYHPISVHNIFDYAYCLLGVVIATKAHKYVPLVFHKKIRILSPSLMIGASVASILIQAIPAFPAELSTALSVLLAVSGGIGFALLIILSGENTSSLPLVKIILASSLGNLLSSAIIFFLGEPQGIRLYALLLTLPILSYIALQFQCRYVATHGTIASVIPKFHQPWRLFILFAAFCFVYGLRSQQLAAGAGRHSSLSTALVMIVLFAAVYFFSDRFSVMRALQAPFALLICGFMLVPGLGISSSIIQDYLISMSYSLMTVLVSLSMYAIAKSHSIPIALMYGVYLATQIFIIIGQYSAILLAEIGLPTSQQEFIINVIAMVIMIAATLFFFFDRNNANHWESHTISQEIENSNKTDDLLFQKKCAAVIEAYHLSPREAEVFELLAQGCSNADIENKLYIAEGTVKAHTRHIYEKLGINSRKSLGEFVKAMDVR